MLQSESPFVSGYVAAIRASHPEIGDAPFADETLARIREDCATFVNSVTDAIGPAAFKATQNDGATFWKLRNDHKGITRFPPITITLGDDGKVRFG